MKKKRKYYRARLVEKAMLYASNAMWSYIEDFKEEYKKPNQVDKMRHRAVKRQCYKRAKKELSK